MRYPVLTQLAVDRLKPRGGRYELADGPGGVPGFAVRIGETGCKSFVLRYRVGGRQRRVTLGSAAVLSLAEARARARKLVDQAKQGIDPTEAKRARHQGTVAAVVQEYVARHVKRNLRSARAIELRLERDIVAAWGPRPIGSITKADVVRLIDALHDRAPVTANRTLQLARRFFRWCVKRSIVESDPTAGVDLPHKEKARARTLSEDEIRAVWGALEVMGWPWGAFGKLLLLSGSRRSEWAEARWSEVDLERQFWHLPPARTKSGVEHVLPLVPSVLAILEALPRIDGSDLVFPGRQAARPITAFSKALARVHELSGTNGWNWHDCRRSTRTYLAKLGVQPHVGERILGHAVGSEVAKVYDLHRYLPEMRQALLLWSAELEQDHQRRRARQGGAASREPGVDVAKAARRLVAEAPRRSRRRGVQTHRARRAHQARQARPRHDQRCAEPGRE